MEVVGANDTVGGVCKDNKNGRDEREFKKNEHTNKRKYRLVRGGVDYLSFLW